MAVNKVLILLAVTVLHTNTQTTLSPTCSSQIYCQGRVLHALQMAGLEQDSKTVVDKKLLYNEDIILEHYDQLSNEANGNISQAQLEQFYNENFGVADELIMWTPKDFVAEPEFLNNIADANYRQFAKDVVAVWPTLGRKITDAVYDDPDSYSLIPVPNGFIVPGGRFNETYYWDTYWILEGLIQSDMVDTAKGMLDNLIYLVKILGHVPNGNRVYYKERSQPPLLMAMAQLYMKATDNTTWLRENIDVLEHELQYWLDTQSVLVRRGYATYKMLRYYAPSEGPRPESYREDYILAEEFNTNDEKQQFYTNIKSAAESGWDFSSRWFITSNGSNAGNLTDIHTRDIIPVDLNSFYAEALKLFGDFKARLRDRRGATKWWTLAKFWRKAINHVLWNEEDGIWYDYNLQTRSHIKYFYPSNVSPFWNGVVEPRFRKYYASRVVEYLRKSGGLDYPGGIPTSLSVTGEQWDSPNAWPPLQCIVIDSLEAMDYTPASELALSLAQTWVRACYTGFSRYHQLFEKYDAINIGEYGGGGEYAVQSGFGWTNGCVLELLAKYGQVLTSSV